jgi:membrane protease YdiL (CAAX protease family)
LNRGGFGRRFLFPMDEQPLPIPPGEKARAVDRWLAPFLIFGLLYIAASVAILGGAMHYGVTATQWLALSAAVVATALCIVIFDRGRWPIGFSGPPLAAVRELLFGGLVAAMLIGFADFLVALMANLHHTRGNGFPWTELIAVYIPAAIHEELLFRGYAYQKMRRWSRVTAIVVLSLLFAVAHMGNRGVTVIAFTNLVIAGVLLALAYELYTRLWFPIGLHLMWNLVSGPIIGYPVSGFVSNPTVLITQVSGPPAITGGAFGLEGSIAVTIAELLAIGWLLSRMYHSPAKKQEIP